MMIDGIEVRGFVATGFEAVAEAFAANFAEGAELGAGFAAILDGHTIVDLQAGFADRDQTRPWSETTLVPVYSTTKPIAALVAAWCVERGLLDYEAPVADIWPEFAAHGKKRVTLAQMLSHQAGVPGFPDPIDPALWLDPPALAAACAALAPMWPPATASGYHPLTWGYLIGEVVHRAAGRTLGAILREEICAPRGIDFHIGTPASEHPRCAEIKRPTNLPQLGELNAMKRAAFLTKWSAPDRGGAIWREIEIPSANGHGTALSVAQLDAAFATGGLVEGGRVISPETCAALTQSRIAGQDYVLPFDVDFAAGIMRNRQLVYGPNPSAYGHSGWGGSMGLADPDRRLSASYVMNRQTHSLQGDPRARRLIAALYGCL
jgi:CubicO group peptidase (beta-lactamase class C family)